MIYEKNISLLREKKFFGLFENLAGKAVEAAELLEELRANYSTLSQISQELNTLEDEADSVVEKADVVNISKFMRERRSNTPYRTAKASEALSSNPLITTG